MLAGSLTLWVLAMAASALAGSFTFLLMSRVALGVVLATVGPASARSSAISSPTMGGVR